MPSVGIREFKANASTIVRKVAEEQAPYTITNHGRAIARIVPIEAVPVPDDIDPDTRSAAVDRFLALADEVATGWEPGLTVQQLLDDMRR